MSMLMLNQQTKISGSEREGIKCLLSTIPEDALYSLCSTVTKGLIIATNKDEAIEAIISFSNSVLELLKRRKLTRDNIFWYLVSQSLKIDYKIDKPQLIIRAIQHWGGQYVEEPDQPNDTLEPRQGTSESSTNTNSSSSTNTTNVQSENMDLATAFLCWYFNVLNSQNPDINDGTSENFCPNHFYDDAHLCVRTVANNEDSTLDEYRGCYAVYTKLLDMVKKDRVLFNANLDNPAHIKVMKEEHGMVKIICAGTLHRIGQCLGVFEQSTLIIRDPIVENNWKVRDVIVNVKVNRNDMSRRELPAPPNNVTQFALPPN